MVQGGNNMKNIWILLLMLLAVPASADTVLLADFPNRMFELPGWRWQGLADTVMGGRSTLESPRIVMTEDGPALRLAGEVVTRGGGFIQVRLQRETEYFDASGFSGIEVDLDAAEGGRYYLFVRTADNRLPWSYYSALLDVPKSRESIRVPWSAFSSRGAWGSPSLRTESISSIAVVAAEEDFQAELNLYQLGLYRQ